MQKVVHLIPYDGIGGVEAAARSMAGVRHASIEFRLRYLFPKVLSREDRLHTFNLFQIWKTARELAAENPDVLIVSLWRSAIAGIIVRLLNPRVRLVLFLHNSADAHGVDYLVTRTAVALSEEIWADSEASLRKRLRSAPSTKQKVISFLAHRIEPTRQKPKACPKFVFWGRLSAQKNLRRAIILFSQIHRLRPDATYTIIGPDGDEAPKIKALVQELGLTHAVRFTGPLSLPDICQQAEDSSFYLQTSLHEGMAMSVVEAMQLGLVPIVTPVGEIATYCNNNNSVLVESNEKTTDAILHLLSNHIRFNELQQNAIQEWNDKPLYKESMLSACTNMFSNLKTDNNI